MRLLFVVNRLTVFLSFCYIYKDFVPQLKAFPPSFCHFCACEMSSGWGHLITWMDPSVEHLNGIFARVGGNLNNNFQKGQMPGGLPGGGHVEASIWPIHNVFTLSWNTAITNKWKTAKSGTILLCMNDYNLLQCWLATISQPPWGGGYCHIGAI